MQKKDSNQRRHLPGWCGLERLSWRAPWGPGFSFVSSASVSSNSSSSNVSFLNGVWISILVSIRVSTAQALLQKRWSRRGGDIRTFRPGFSSTETAMQMILNDESKHSYQISGFIQIWFGYPSPPSYTNYLPGLVTSSRQRLTRNTKEQEDVTTL